MNDTCIINYATKHFVAGQNRLLEESQRVGYKGDFLLFNGTKPLDCPPHETVPYAFKPYAMKRAQELNYKYILWLDSSVYPVKSMDSIWQIIKDVGYYFNQDGNNCGVWTSDKCLDNFGVSREDAFDIPMMIAGCQGLNLENVKARAYLDKLYETSNDGISFHGSWTNNNKEVSQDPRVKGHRHDQSVSSIVSWKLGMREWQKNIVGYNPPLDKPLRDSWVFIIKGV